MPVRRLCWSTIMPTDLSYPHIEKPEGQPARLCSTPRVRVAQIVMAYLYHGQSVDDMCRAYDYLSAAEAHAATAYYFDHKTEVDAEIAEEQKLADEDGARPRDSSFRG